ncbi:MOSC domain-containing protein [Methylocapsa sp. S129]|uniref:MOSC domain-containing protein n=1 Tax=Methylocapsa sp. S129 TaxID=1641869 RepID=UPI00131D552E|nr:MOSC domain-containing protein [Methylocapsa sp. S129]
MSVAVRGLYHYPVKGLSAQALAKVRLIAGEGFPFDRVYGLARHDSGYDPTYFQPLPKSRFIVLVKEDRLAGLSTFFDTETKTLDVSVQGQPVLSENLETERGRAEVVRFFSNMFDLQDGREPSVAVGGENRFTDLCTESKEMMNAISLINLATVRDFESRISAAVDPLRFRANLYFDGLPAYRELEMLGREIEVGPARLRIFQRTERCAATEVNPIDARRDIAVPRLLMKHLGHADMGVYAEVIEGGMIEIGSQISIS